MKSILNFQNAVIDTTFYFADMPANLQNEILNYSDIYPESDDYNVGLALFYSEIQDKVQHRNASEMLLKLIQALNLEMNNALQYELKSQEYLPLRNFENSQIKRFVFFGIPPGRLQLHVDAKKYVVYQWKGKDLLFCDPLPVMNDNKELRLKLWQTLKNLFHLK